MSFGQRYLVRSKRLILAPKNSVGERFWKKVARGRRGCWLWQAYTDKLGYGRFQMQNSFRIAHRVSWELSFGPIPKGMHVLHRCDVRNCVNPKHLWLGTHQDNMTDKKIKGRASAARGELCKTSILKTKQVIEIKKRLALGESQTELGKEFKVSNHAIHKIHKGINWRHL